MNELLHMQNVFFDSKDFLKKDAPKKVEILDIGNNIASTKVIAWWGIDYILLSKRAYKWMIEQVYYDYGKVH